MTRKPEDEWLMEMTWKVSERSRDPDTQVGAIIVKDNNIIAVGFNGTPYGYDNECKHSCGTTKREVVHAEMNAIIKAARGNGGTEGATMYTTLRPCIECAKAIVQAGITRVVWEHTHKCDKGAMLLLHYKNQIELATVKTQED